MKSEKANKKATSKKQKDKLSDQDLMERLLAIPPERRNPRANYYIKYEGKPFFKILDMKAVLK